MTTLTPTQWLTNLLDSDWGFEEIITEVEIKKRFNRMQAVHWCLTKIDPTKETEFSQFLTQQTQH
ncbi:MAG TPA: hypothetical protein DCG72_06315 [Gammaproteobacteria bacterium]|nr:hypothetical protein [Gammaproteobacteria bacterium]